MTEQTLVQPPPSGMALGGPRPAPAPPSFYQSHKYAVWAGGGLLGLIAAYLLYKKFSGSSATASTAATTGTPAPTNTGGYGGTMDGSTLASTLAQEEQAIAANTQAIQSGDATLNKDLVDLNASQAKDNAADQGAAGKPSNPYPVGFKASPTETVVTALWDPQENSWFSETNQGGVYTSRHLGLTGSAYGHGPFAPGSLKILPGGKSFIETNTKGQKFQYSVR